MGQALPYQPLIKKMFYTLVYSMILWRHFLACSSVIINNSSFGLIDIEHANRMVLILGAVYTWMLLIASSVKYI